MKMFLELLSELSARTKHTEEVATATREKNRDKLESMRAKLKTSVSDRNEKVKSSMGDVRSSVSAHFTSIRSKLDLAGEEHDLKKVEHRADRAEQDAADAIDFALYAVDQVEWLVIDAALARADADDAAMVRN